MDEDDEGEEEEIVYAECTFCGKFYECDCDWQYDQHKDELYDERKR